MKKKLLTAAVFAAVALTLTACGNREKTPKISLGAGSDGKSAATAADNTVVTSAQESLITTMDSETLSNIPEKTEPEEAPLFGQDNEDFAYTEDENGEIVITGYNGKGGEISIPAEIEGKAVVKIGELAFDGRSDITAINIPEGIKDIDNCAFRGCGITEITIPSTVKKIGVMAFRDCTSLETAILSEGVEAIESAFYNCSNLSRVDIPQSLVSIGSMAFLNCDKLEEVTISDNTEFLGERAFENCTVSFKGESYFMKVYDQTLYIAVNGEGHHVPDGVPPSA